MRVGYNPVVRVHTLWMATKRVHVVGCFYRRPEKSESLRPADPSQNNLTVRQLREFIVPQIKAGVPLRAEHRREGKGPITPGLKHKQSAILGGVPLGVTDDAWIDPVDSSAHFSATYEYDPQTIDGLLMAAHCCIFGESSLSHYRATDTNPPKVNEVSMCISGRRPFSNILQTSDPAVVEMYKKNNGHYGHALTPPMTDFGKPYDAAAVTQMLGTLSPEGRKLVEALMKDGDEKARVISAQSRQIEEQQKLVVDASKQNMCRLQEYVQMVEDLAALATKTHMQAYEALEARAGRQVSVDASKAVSASPFDLSKDEVAVITKSASGEGNVADVTGAWSRLCTVLFNTTHSLMNVTKSATELLTAPPVDSSDRPALMSGTQAPNMQMLSAAASALNGSSHRIVDASGSGRKRAASPPLVRGLASTFGMYAGATPSELSRGLSVTELAGPPDYSKFRHFRSPLGH